MYKQVDPKTREKTIEKVRHSKRARGFILVLGLGMLCLAIYLFFVPKDNVITWIYIIFGSLGLFFVVCARYANQKTINLLEHMMTGWP